MNSWQARFFNAWVRRLVRRERWGGDERAVARRARRLFGSPLFIQRLRTFGLRVEPVRGGGGVRGEWLTPPDAGPGAVLYIHGGGYVSCSPSTHRPIAAALARGTGRRVFSPDYRLAPEHRYPAALDDAVAAYEWLLGQGLPPASVSLAGDSAGGGLVLGTLLRLRDAGRALPACAVCFSPWTDLAGEGESVAGNDGRCQMFRPSNVGEFASAYLGGASPFDPYASPARADLGGLPPVLLQVGSTELLLDDSRRVHAKILEAGGRSELEVYEDIFHCWQMLDGIVPEAGEALRRASLFILRHTGAEQFQTAA
ncbi:MAG TPA: alpha/beta hydrolase [Pyrinomonadaceae bacterium]|jgi:acetyl esterase/lipase|nr:alpha/beta hydrolase [Pyrinomonadaceae bacterium]